MSSNWDYIRTSFGNLFDKIWAFFLIVGGLFKNLLTEIQNGYKNISGNTEYLFIAILIFFIVLLILLTFCGKRKPTETTNKDGLPYIENFIEILQIFRRTFNETTKENLDEKINGNLDEKTIEKHIACIIEMGASQNDQGKGGYASDQEKSGYASDEENDKENIFDEYKPSKENGLS